VSCTNCAKRLLIINFEQKQWASTGWSKSWDIDFECRK